MPTVRIGPKLFSKEKAMYRDWVTALIRENLQNSVDSGASAIGITIEDDGALKKLTFTDNGPGMTMKTLEDVYFVLGETTKTTPNSIGGFGVARMLTCFAQEKYTLRTHDILVEGYGAEWTPTTGFPHQKGVTLTIWMNPDGRDVFAAFKKYLRSCHINVEVTFNGERWKEWTYKNKFERKLSFGSVFTNKSKETGILVRSNGVTMFAPYMSAPFQVVIELDASRSREILQAHRDGLLSVYQAELESFIGELNINKQSALREKRSKSTTFEGTGTFTATRSKKETDAKKQVDALEAALLEQHLTIPDKIKDALIKTSNGKREELIATILKDNGIEAPAFAPRPMHDHGFHIEEARERLSMELFSIVLHDDTSNAKVRKVIDSYNPKNWDLLGQSGSRYDKRYGERRAFRAGVDKYKLLVLWKAACEFAIRMMQDNLQRGGDNIAWGVGWIFSNNALAEIKPGDGVDWLLINPCDIDGKMRLSLSDKRDMVRLLSSAAHEVAHIVYGDHDEQFANLLNDLMEEIMANLSEALNFLKSEKADAEGRLNELAAA
jgi:hypothetical protein